MPGKMALASTSAALILPTFLLFFGCDRNYRQIVVVENGKAEYVTVGRGPKRNPKSGSQAGSWLSARRRPSRMPQGTRPARPGHVYRIGDDMKLEEVAEFQGTVPSDSLAYTYGKQFPPPGTALAGRPPVFLVSVLLKKAPRRGTPAAKMYRCLLPSSPPWIRKAAPARVEWAWRAVLALAALANLIGSWTYGLLDENEGRYAAIAREMLTRHDWIVPHLNGVPDLGSPPCSTGPWPPPSGSSATMRWRSGWCRGPSTSPRRY